MNLKQVHIQNFRSIADLKIDFDYNCQCLIGINESGKSNILRALHLLDPNVPVVPNDVRIERYDEPQVNSGQVRFIFDLESTEIEELIATASESISSESLDLPLVKAGDKTLSLKEFCHAKSSLPVNQGLHQITIPQGARSSTYWARPSNEALVLGWHRNKSGAAVAIASESRSITVPQNGFHFFGDGEEPKADVFEKATIKHLNARIGAAVTKIVDRELPSCIFWRYADKYLLPSSVDVAAFCANPDSCVPLKSMFELAGYSADSLATTISAAQAQGHYRYVQILEKTAAKATEHIRSVWSDHKSVRLKLESHGATLSPIVTDDMVPLDMTNRSDGFKRFVSFLLQISAKVRTAEFENCLILIDEPEIALHPSGAKNLLKELIEIGKSNLVVFSTHSIFMIDKATIPRHIVVEKKKEVTATWRAEKSRIQDEEVLYSAIGFSIFEALKEHNVIFEGWRDKCVFDAAATALSKKDPLLRERLESIGFTYAEGAKDIKNVARFLQLASRACLIVSDSDNAAMQQKRAYETSASWGKWKTLQEILPDAVVHTGEDLLLRSAVVKRANKFLAGRNLNLQPLAEGFFAPNEFTLAGLRRWLGLAGLPGAEFEQTLNALKDAMFVDLKRAELNECVDRLVAYIGNHDFSNPA